LVVKVIFDANFLFVPSQFRIDVFEEVGNLLKQRFEPVILSATLEELEKLAKKGSPKVRKQALLGLELAKKCRVIEAKPSMNESYDDVIVRAALDLGGIVATNDRTLKRKLRNKGVAVIYLREKTHLELEGTV